MRTDIEKALIGHVFAFGQVEQFCARMKPSDFSTYPDVVTAICDLYQKGALVNYLTVGDYMAREDYPTFQKVTIELQECSDLAGLPSDFDKLTLILYEHRLRDELRRTHEVSDEEDVFDFLELTDSRILEMVSTMRSGGHTPNEILERIKQMEAGVLTYGMPLNVNVALTDLVVVAARPSMGKTAFAVKCALNTARMGIPVGFASREMSAEEIAARVLSIISRVPYSRVIEKSIFATEAEALDRAAEEFSTLPFHIIEPPSKLSGALAKCRNLIANEGIKALFVDYLQLFDGEGNNREQQVADVSRSFKALAMDTRVPVMLLSQLSREVEKRVSKMPHLSDLRESGAIEQDANIVMMLYRPWYYEEEKKKPFEVAGVDYIVSEDLVVVGVEKYRNGKTGRRVMKWVGEYMDFRPWDHAI